MKKPCSSFEPFSLSRPYHELFSILVQQIAAYEKNAEGNNLISVAGWLLKEYGERYQIREFYREATYVYTFTKI